MNDARPSLAAFFGDRLDEDEAKARAVTLPPEWHQGSDVDDDWADDELLCWWPPEFQTPYEQDKHWRGETISGPENCAFMATWDPKRVLADVTAKRRVLDGYVFASRSRDEIKARIDAEHASGGTASAQDLSELRDAITRVDVLEEAVELLAAAYADHRNYREEWRP